MHRIESSKRLHSSIDKCHHLHSNVHVVRDYSENKTILNNSLFSWANQLTSRKINTSRRWSLQGTCEVSISMQLVEIVNNGTNNNKLTTLACLRPLSRYEVSFLYILWYSQCILLILMSYSCLSGISCVICNILWLTIWSFLLFSLDNDLRRRGEWNRIIHESRQRYFTTDVWWAFLVLILWIISMFYTFFLMRHWLNYLATRFVFLIR